MNDASWFFSRRSNRSARQHSSFNMFFFHLMIVHEEEL